MDEKLVGMVSSHEPLSGGYMLMAQQIEGVSDCGWF